MSGAPADRPPPRRALLALTIGGFVVGATVMIFFESTPARIVGVVLLFTFIVSGVFLIADPAWLGRDDE
jgi:hypothetical protein